MTRQLTHYAIDSRKVKEGSCFFALPGERTDGHNYLEQVAANGGMAAVVSEAYLGEDFGLELVRVPSVLGAFHRAAKEAFAKKSCQTVAITGSMGKTTTKEFLATLLKRKYKVFKTEGNQNTQLSVPLQILNAQEDHEVMVLEMAMGQKGDIARLVDIAPPDIAMVTRIAPAGMEDFAGGLDNIAKAKAEVFSQKKTRLGIISHQAASFKVILHGGTCEKWIYGLEQDAFDKRAVDFVMDKNFCVNDSPPLDLQLEGRQLHENALGAITAARALGLSWSEIQEKVGELTPFENRFEKVEKRGITYIQDSYNANPDSVKAAIENLPQPKGEGRVIGVLGSMVDLGEASPYYHKQVGHFAKHHLDLLFSVGKEAKGLSDAFSASGKPALHFTNLDTMKEKLNHVTKPGDVVLIKGENGLALWTILED